MNNMSFICFDVKKKSSLKHRNIVSDRVNQEKEASEYVTQTLNWTFGLVYSEPTFYTSAKSNSETLYP